MPNYDYHCEANGRTVEVRHGLAMTLSTWGEVCEHAGIAPGETPTHALVERLITIGQVVQGQGKQVACAPGGCGLPRCARQ